jgi:hypothetical protein
MRTLLPTLLFCTGVAANAATPIAMTQLVEQSMGDSTSRALLGRSITVQASRFGELGFETPASREVTFVCDSGDKSLTGKKPKAATFEGVTSGFQGWEGVTVWRLKDCRTTDATAGKAAPAATAVPATLAGVYVAGNAQWQGDLTLKGQSVTISTASQRGTCDLSGAARFTSPTTAELRVADLPQCKATLAFHASGVRVKTQDCAADACGAGGPGLDHDFKRKSP